MRQLFVGLLLAASALLLLHLFLLSPFLLSPSLFPPPFASAPKLIFLLAGQSNMAGRGGVTDDNLWDGSLPSQCLPSSRVLRFSAAGRWVTASEPLHADIDVAKTCGVGPGMAFANAVVGSEVVVGLVPCAVGGSRIRMWRKGEALYCRAVERAGAAVRKGGGRIGAVLWFQGESDTIELEDAEAYGGRMVELVKDIRTDLGLPELLIIHVAIASGEGNYTDIVREAQKNISLHNVVLVDAKGLPLRDDNLHLTTDAQVQLGDMLARAFLKFNSSLQ